MEWIFKIIDQKFAFKARKLLEHQGQNSVDYPISKQFLVSHHQDSLQISLIAKSTLNRG